MKTCAFPQYSVVVLLLGTAVTAPAQLYDANNINVSTSANNSTAATIAAGDANGQIAIVADPVAAGGDLFDVIVNDPAAVVSLKLPNATVVTSANASTLGFTYTTYTNPSYMSSLYAGTFNLAGTHIAILLPPAQVPGTYTLLVNAAAAQNPVLVIASFVSSSPVRAGATTTAATYKIGDTVVITGLVFNGSSPITDATVTARIVDTGNLTAVPPEVPLVDSGQFDAASGDGLYTGTYTASSAGKFLAVVKATGTAATGNYTRTASASFAVVQPMARFTAFTDAGVDDNANGKPDRVVVSAALNVQQAATYRVGIALQASNGNVIKTSVKSALSAGTPTVPLSFKSTDIIAKLAVDGPYTLRDAVLQVVDGVSNPLVDFVDTPGTTSAYSLSSLDPGSQARFTGQNTVTGVDSNTDGKLDILRVQAGVVVPAAGTYSWSASLFNSAGLFLTVYNKSASLTAGANTVNFDFSGSALGQACASGVFSVKSALLYGSTTSAFADHLVDTQSFSGSQFTGAACFLIAATPNAGALVAGQTQTFTFSYTDPNGAADLSYVSVLINSSIAPGAACNIAWNAADHTIRLYDDQGDGGYTYAQDTFNTFGNNQCTITYNNPITTSGNDLTFTISIAFSATFLGKQNIYLEAKNAASTDTGLQQFGAVNILPTSPCDLNSDQQSSVADVQSMINQALGITAAASDLNHDHKVNLVDMQIVLNAALNMGCSSS